MTERFSPTALFAFELFFRPWMRRRVITRIAGLPRDLPVDRPVVLVSNHTTFWDPFVLREMHRLFRPRAPIRTIMLERELSARPFFRSIGVIGLDPSSAGGVRRMLRSLERAVSQRRDSVITYFPQGRIWPSWRRPLGFQRGIEMVLRRLAPLTILPIGLHLESLASPSPSIFALAGDPIPSADGELEAALLERAVESLVDRIHAHLETYGEASGRHWPPPFEPMAAPALPAASPRP
jgi:1-acyl-sn-glycerol-3-phosphate acyltransferase